MSYLGDFATSAIVYGKFTTVDTGGIPATLGGTPVLSVYKDDSTTESTTGVTLTVSLDSRTGMNQFKIDLSADLAFYAAGHDFQVVVTTGTVSGSSVVGYVVGEFSIQNRYVATPSGTVSANVVQWRGSTPNALTAGRVETIVGAIGAAVIAAASFATGALDFLFSRDSSNWEAAAIGGTKRNLGTAIMAAVHKVLDTGAGSFRIYKSDDVTSAFTQGIATDATLDPVKERDGAV